MQLRRSLQTLHRWLGLVLAAQILLWMSSGVVMSLLPISLVHGDPSTAYSAPLELKVHNYFPPGGVLSETDGPQELALKTWLGREVYVVTSRGGKAMFDADTGNRLSPISENDARRVALADFAGEGDLEKIALLNHPPHEYKGPSPVWRADFSDRDRTRLYISPETGAVLSRRNRVWRFYDFFWMLHIMDYRERENFNNPLVRTFAVTGLGFALSGFALVVLRLRSGRYAEDARRVARKSDPDGSPD
jgi:hypothetical protein